MKKLNEEINKRVAKRWEKDPDLSHELYTCGHLYEAATAHYISTGKRSLLDIAIKNADLLVKDFLEGGLTYEPGHQIVEMGLVKMYRVTGNEKYLKLQSQKILERVDRFGGKPWSEQLPHNERITINGETYVHWYDCISDYIL